MEEFFMKDLNKINEIIAAVRRIYKFVPEYSDLVKMKANAVLKETDEGLVLSRIEFNWYDSIVITKNAITLHREHDGPKELMSFDSFEDFLEKTKA
jgi:hypothetical protein